MSMINIDLGTEFICIDKKFQNLTLMCEILPSSKVGDG